MSYKPYRGHGIKFKAALEKEQALREELCSYQLNPQPFQQYSKTYYRWMKAMQALDYIQLGELRPLSDYYGRIISQSTLQSFEQHLQLCYKPFQILSISIHE